MQEQSVSRKGWGGSGRFKEKRGARYASRKVVRVHLKKVRGRTRGRKGRRGFRSFNELEGGRGTVTLFSELWQRRIMKGWFLLKGTGKSAKFGAKG